LRGGLSKQESESKRMRDVEWKDFSAL